MTGLLDELRAHLHHREGPAMTACTQVAYDATADNLHRLTDHHPYAQGGYENGAITRYIWTAADWALFPGSYHIKINVTGDPSVGNALDVETGDATPAAVEPWINARIGATQDPLLVYCNRANLDAVLAERAKTKWHDRVFMWVATLDGTLMDGRAMTQCFQLRDSAGAYADVSLIRSGQLAGLMAARVGKQH